MKVLFIASNPSDSNTLSLEREITELQQQFSEAAGEPVSFRFSPGLYAEDLPAEISRFKPDILHISAHGDQEKLSLSNASGDRVALTPEALVAFMPLDQKPRLVYLNACDSQDIAAKLALSVPLAIGSTAPITNRAARAGARTFYERLLAGAPVQDAFNVAKNMVETLQNRQASAVLYARPGIDPTKVVLHNIPRVIADFHENNAIPNQRGEYRVRFGLEGCPINTTQVVFFTDEEKFVDHEDRNANHLCLVARGRPSRAQKAMLLNPEIFWEVKQDFRLFAVGVTAEGVTFSTGSTLCEAIERNYSVNRPGHLMTETVATAIAQLRGEGEGSA